MPVALLMKPSGGTFARLEVAELADMIDHGGRRWVRSHATVSGAAYQVERKDRRPSAIGNRENEPREIAATRAAWRAAFGQQP